MSMLHVHAHVHVQHVHVLNLPQSIVTHSLRLSTGRVSKLFCIWGPALFQHARWLHIWLQRQLPRFAYQSATPGLSRL